jgi:CrcB protein
MRLVLLLAGAGALGSLSRYGLGGLIQRLAGAGFPYGTLVINVLGCLAIGFIMQIGLNTNVMSATTRVTITVGFLGAFTTFSSFSYETVKLLESGEWSSAILNMGSNLGLGILATTFGILIGRAVLGGI